MADAANPLWRYDFDKILASDADAAMLRDAYQGLLKLHKRQTRQLNRLVKMADANAAKLAQSNATLDQLCQNLARFVPQPVYNKLLDGKAQQLQAAKRAKLTLFFSDIIEFTALTEQLEPEQLATLMNAYFTEMATICHRWGGTLDQFIGDAVVIFFGDPDSKGSIEDACSATLMGLEMQQRLAALRTKWAAAGIRMPMHVRMGISTGFCTVGNIGSQSRLHYTALGNVVNEAARIQALCPADRLLISEDTYQLVCQRISCAPYMSTTLHGRQRETHLYEPVNRPDTAGSDLIVGNENGFKLYLDSTHITDRARIKLLLKNALEAIHTLPDDTLNTRSDG
jgi:adenylate cyclase